MRRNPSKHIPTSVSAPEEWISWHKSLKRWFTKKEANEHWVRFWNQRSGAGSEADSHALRSYMDSQGVNLETDATGKVVDFTASVADWIGDTINWTRILAFSVAILAVGVAAYYIIHSTQKGKSIGEMAIGIKGLNPKRLALG